MAFDPTVPQAGQPLDAGVVRNQFNALNDQLTGAFAALDWSNGAPKLPDKTTIANPVSGNLAYDYVGDNFVVYSHGEWCYLT